MARTFVAASSQRMERSVAPVNAYPFTFAGWCKPVSIVDGGYHSIVSVTKIGGSIISLYQHNADIVAWVTADVGVGGGTGATVSGVTAGNWHHAAGVFLSSTSRTAYLNGTAGSAETTAQTTLTVDTVLVGSDHYTSPNDFFNGDLAECAIWSVALDAAELAALAKGFDPRLIRPQSLVAFWPITGNDSPEIDRWKNGYELTITGSPAKIDHPRVYRKTHGLFSGVGTLVAPATPNTPAPPDATTGRSVIPTLTWAASGATSYDVYFGTAASPPLVVSGQAAASYVPGTLSSLRTYYWKIVAINAAGSTTGPIWSFTTTNQYAIAKTIGGVTPRMRISGLRVRDLLNDAPNTCSFLVEDTAPTVGQEFLLGLGTLEGSDLLMAGAINTVEQIYEGKPANLAWMVSAQDYTVSLNSRKVRKRYSQQSATAIVLDLIATYAPTFTTDHVALSLPTVTGGIDFTDEDVGTCLTRLAKRIGGYWYPDYVKDIHFFVTEVTSVPDTLVPSLPSLLLDPPVTVYVDRTQIRTRVYVEGGGAAAKAPALAGSTTLAVEDPTWYLSGGGVVVSGPQRITYTGVVAGGAGALVGTTITPTNAPTANAIGGAGVDAGNHSYKQTFITASGETLPSPTSPDVITGVAITAPVTAPVATKKYGGVLSAGDYQWKVTYLDVAGGETTPSSASAVVTMDGIAAPTTIGTVSTYGAGGGLNITADYTWVYTFVSHSDPTIETTRSPISNTVHTGSGGHDTAARMTRSGVQTPPSGFDRQFYRTDGGGSTYKKMPGSSDGFDDNDANYFYDVFQTDAMLGATAPSSSTAVYRQADVVIPVSPDPATTQRRLYRTVAGGSTFKLVATIADNTTTTYTDNIADGSLGANAPSSNTTLKNQVALTNIAIGPTGTTQRKVYRTAAGGAVWKLLTTIANNTATTYTDATADSGLGATAPVTDTSGLTTATGEVAAGSTSIVVTSTAPFRSAGGWAFIGSLPIHYTGFSSTALTGVPTTGVGALTTTVRYAVEIVAAPMLVGIPASGTGAILYDILDGDPVNLLVQCDDVAAQSALAAIDGSDGIVEHVIQDRRLSFAEAQAIGNADLSIFSRAITSVRYYSHDPKTRSGKTVSINLPSISVVGDFTIQSVEIDQIGIAANTYPRYHVEASSVRFSLEDVLRRLHLDTV